MIEPILRKIGALIDILLFSIIFGFAVCVYWIIYKIWFFAGK